MYPWGNGDGQELPGPAMIHALGLDIMGAR
jgi:hypothetical protein